MLHIFHPSSLSCADGSIRVIDQFNGDKLLIKAAHAGRVTSLQLHPSSLPTAASAAALGTGMRRTSNG